MRSVTVALLGTLAIVQSSKPPTFADLANRTYSLGPEDKRTVTLVDGTGKDEEGGTFVLLREFATGDLDGDHRLEAAAILKESSGGTGSFYYLFVFLNKSGTFAQVEQPEWLGDRSLIKGIRITRGVVGVRFVTHRPQDPECCPTLEVENRYRLVKDKLVAVDLPD
jgi:hypothetical protein